MLSGTTSSGTSVSHRRTQTGATHTCCGALVIASYAAGEQPTREESTALSRKATRGTRCRRTTLPPRAARRAKVKDKAKASRARGRARARNQAPHAHPLLRGEIKADPRDPGRAKASGRPPARHPSPGMTCAATFNAARAPEGKPALTGTPGVRTARPNLTKKTGAAHQRAPKVLRRTCPASASNGRVLVNLARSVKPTRQATQFCRRHHC